MHSAIIVEGLESVGFVHVAEPLKASEYRTLASSIGAIVGDEQIALRPGAHAYVAKPGPVPLHTDHPEVDVVAWHCEEQDVLDGASLLLDTRPVVAGLPCRQRNLLNEVMLACPPLKGGPPMEQHPVLRTTPLGVAVFCSPWLRSASPIPSHEAALESFRMELSTRAKERVFRIRLRAGEALFVDNRRVLHGRAAIVETSRRRLQRLWIQRREIRTLLGEEDGQC